MAQAALFKTTIYSLATHGDPVVVGGKKTLELRHGTMWFKIGQYPLRRQMSHRLIVAEATSILAGTYDFGLLQAAAPKADHALFTGQMAYGPRAVGGLAAVVAELAKDPASRRAVVNVGRHTDKAKATRPCTNHLQYLVRDGVLEVDASMRSWDLAYGLPVDFGVFGAVSQAVAACLDVGLGNLYVHFGSLHMYEETAHLCVDEDGINVGAVYPTAKFWELINSGPNPTYRLKRLRNYALNVAIPAHRAGDWTNGLFTTTKVMEPILLPSINALGSELVHA